MIGKYLLPPFLEQKTGGGGGTILCVCVCVPSVA